MTLVNEVACAKINLTLEVLGRRPDGYHELLSLVAFATDACDYLSLAPGSDLTLVVHGPEAGAIDGANLITLIAESVRAAHPAAIMGHFSLEKNLPVASGIGGGSADAAAAVRCIAHANGIRYVEDVFSGIAAAHGADIPVCLGGGGQTAAFMSGIGENIWRPSGASLLPSGGLAAVLVNPRTPVATGAVFQALAAPPLAVSPVAAPPAQFASRAACIAYIAASSNDLEAPALTVAPIIADVLHDLRSIAGCRLARMSGSGATCFALFDTLDDAASAAVQLQQSRPDWWIKATRLQ